MIDNNSTTAHPFMYYDWLFLSGSVETWMRARRARGDITSRGETTHVFGFCAPCCKRVRYSIS